RRLAWTSDEAGSELYVARVRDLASAADLADTVPDVSGAPVWTADASAFYYVRLDAPQRPNPVVRHQVGTAAEADALVYASPDPGYFVAVSETQSGDYAEISTYDHESSECRLLDLRINDAQPMLIAAREEAVLYEVEHHPAFAGEPVLLVRTNA